jgi:hypothetical protein
VPGAAGPGTEEGTHALVAERSTHSYRRPILQERKSKEVKSAHSASQMADACDKGDTGGSWCRLVCNSTVQGSNCCGVVMMVYRARTACTGACSCGMRAFAAVASCPTAVAGVYRACPLYGGAPEKTAAITSDHHGASKTTKETSPDDEDDQLP